jgi:glycosyltransferase involved in cell wall biosynthesis
MPRDRAEPVRTGAGEPASPRLRVLVITKIFPNAREPLSAPFNRQQFAALGRLCDVEVLAAIPWYPGARLLARWSAAGRLADVPSRDVIAGLPVSHPRFVFLPRIGHAATGSLYAACLLRQALSRRGRVDVVLGSWAYPDGFAAVVLAHLMGVPAVIKLHGSDINVLATQAGPRANLRWALPRASRVVAVSRALAEQAVALGAARERVVVVPNGVDRQLFRPRSRAEACARLALSPARRLLYVGRLEPPKGVDDLLAAFDRLAARLPDVELALVGDGSARRRCEAMGARTGGRVVVAGSRALDEVPWWMAAADAVVLPSLAEGMPNVLLEALACGRRVVATRVGGIPDLIACDQLGELVEPQDVPALAEALARAAAVDYDAAAVAALGGRGGWEDSAARLHAVLQEARGRTP